MRLRILWLGSAAIFALLAAYYAGYRQGSQRRLAPGQVAAGPVDESDRLREPSLQARPVKMKSGNITSSNIKSSNQDDYATLLARDLTMPLSDVKGTQIVDTFDQARAVGKRHEATDIMSPRGTPVHAIQDGTIRKLFLSKAGGNTIYQFDPEGIYCFYYAHLDRYAEGVHEDMKVKKGDVIGYVGSTGDASREAPHLHFAIVRLGPDKKWWQGTAINPYPILVRLASR